MAVTDYPAATVGQSGEQRGDSRRAVSITGRGADVAFVIDENAPIEVVARDLGAQLTGRGALFSEGGVSVDTGSRVFSSWEKAAIQRIFKDNSGLRISRFVSSAGDDATDPEDLEDPIPFLRLPVPAPLTTAPAAAPVPITRFSDFSRSSQRNRSHALVISSTFRSGETIRHYADVVVLGDVNPGSEIAADGDIVVMGALKGLVHAGAGMDNRAAIIALDITSPRLRIGDYEAVATGSASFHGRGAKAGSGGPAGPSIAYVRRGRIYVSPFAGRFARYTKGVLYDG